MYTQMQFLQRIQCYNFTIVKCGFIELATEDVFGICLREEEVERKSGN
jgi:hypothetical protein